MLSDAKDIETNLVGQHDLLDQLLHPPRHNLWPVCGARVGFAKRINAQFHDVRWKVKNTVFRMLGGGPVCQKMARQCAKCHNPGMPFWPQPC